MISTGYSVKSVYFESSLDGTISHKVLKTPTPLPQNFIFCGSFKEKMIDNNNFFTIYGHSDNPWLSLSTWIYGNRIDIWMKINKVWLKIRDIPPYWMNFYIHVCIFADIISGQLSLSFNGEPAESVTVPEIKLEKPKDLSGKLYIGLSENHHLYGKTQFQGQVANINIFSGNDSRTIRKMSANLCDQVGDIVNFESEWVYRGLVNETLAEKWKICNKNETYTLGVPKNINYEEAKKVCKKLGASNMTEAKNKKDLENVLSLFMDSKASCDFVWTPFTDEEHEGEFRSDVTGELATFLPWHEESPNGGNDENHVTIHIPSGAYYDYYKGLDGCPVCDLPKGTVFSFLGVCKKTYFGNRYSFCQLK